MRRAVHIFAILLFVGTGVLYAQRTLLVSTNDYRVLYPTNFWPSVSNDVNSVVAAGAGLGTVTSVGATSVVSGLSFIGSPITGAGTLILTGAVASGSVTSVAASTTIPGLGWTGSPITSAGTLGLTGVVGEASIDAALARLASPALTGDPTGPTASADDNDTSLATTAYVQGEETALKSAQLWQATNANLTTLATLNGASLTNLNGTEIRSGTVADARIDAAIARLASPVFTGDPTGPTPSADDNDTSLATTAYVQTEETALKAAQLWQATNSVLTAFTTAKRRVAFWDATQFKPITNSAAAAIPAVRGNGFHNYTFSASVDQSVVVHGIVPATGVVDLTGGIKVNMILTSSGTSTTNVYSFALMRWTTDLDSDSYDTAVNVTNIVSATSGTPTTVTATVTTIDSMTNGDPFSLLVSRLSASSASDTASETTQVYSVEITED